MTAGEKIDRIIAGMKDWRGAVAARIRRVIHEADPEVVEEIKWRGAPVWSHDGNLCVLGAFQDKVKLTFPHGAHLPDPRGLFNNGLDGKEWRAIDIREHDELDEEALKDLVRAAAAYNRSTARAGSGRGTSGRGREKQVR
ncbi:MAG TPA: DUF1801 domain-containing protein [Bacillota bacterium]